MLCQYCSTVTPMVRALKLKLKERVRDHRIPRGENPQRVRAETSLHSMVEGGMCENAREG